MRVQRRIPPKRGHGEDGTEVSPVPGVHVLGGRRRSGGPPAPVSRCGRPRTRTPRPRRARRAPASRTPSTPPIPLHPVGAMRGTGEGGNCSKRPELFAAVPRGTIGLDKSFARAPPGLVMVSATAAVFSPRPPLRFPCVGTASGPRGGGGCPRGAEGAAGDTPAAVPPARPPLPPPAHAAAGSPHPAANGCPNLTAGETCADLVG